MEGVDGGQAVAYTQPAILSPSTGILGISSPVIYMSAFPNPFSQQNTIKFRVENTANVTIILYDMNGKLVKTLLQETKGQGDYTVDWNTAGLSSGTYFARAMQDDKLVQTLKLIKAN